VNLQVVEVLNKKHPEKMHFYLTKADTVASENDRQKVLIQITQGLSKRINNKNFDLLPIYLPRPGNENCPVENHLNDVCVEIDKTINLYLQKNLHNLETDAKLLSGKCDEALALHRANRSVNLNQLAKGAVFWALSLIPISLILLWVVNLSTPLHASLPLSIVEAARPFAFEGLSTLYFLLGNLLVVLLIHVFTRLAFRKKPTLASSSITRLTAAKAFLDKAIVQQQKDLYDSYFKATLTNHGEN
jgi:hypothetical protein